MSREEMINEVIRTLGMENKFTIWFCKLEEDKSISNEMLETAMVVALTVANNEIEED